MNVVAVRNDNQKVFESQSFMDENQKQRAIQNLVTDAESAEIEITISEMTDEELKSAISGHSVD